MTVALVTMSLTLACGETPPCPEVTEHVVALPSGPFGPAVSDRILDPVDGEPLPGGPFPRGATDPDFEPSSDVTTPGGTAVPSARILVDRAAHLVVRTYVDDEGRMVEERWNMSVVTP